MIRGLTLGAAFFVAACGNASQEHSGEVEGVGPIVTERWVRVESANASPMLRVSGRFIHDASAHAEIAAPARATVLSVHVQPGATVARGDLLVTLALPDAIDARGARSAAQLRGRAYSERLARLQELAHEGLARGADIADVRMRLAEAQASEEEANAHLRAVSQSGIVMRGDHAELRAPIAGVITNVDAPIGASVDVSSTPLVSIVASHGRRLEARVPFPITSDVHMSWLRDDGGRSILTFVGQAPEVAASDGMQLTWFDSPDVAGVAGSVAALSASVDNAWIVPNEALAVQATGSELRTREHGNVHVTELFHLGGSCVVRGPLEAGDYVALRTEHP